MRRNPKLVRVVFAAFAVAIALPVAMTVASRVAHASGYMFASGEGCDPTPDNPTCVAQ